MSYRIRGLAPEQFEAYFNLDDDTLHRLGARRVHADSDGLPCRISLEHAEIGEELLLLNHEHQSANSPYRASHAIFIRKDRTRAAESIDEVPVILSSRLLSVRGFDPDGMMLEAEVCEGVDLAHLIEAMLANQQISYLHAHTARRGCYLARIERSEAQG